MQTRSRLVFFGLFEHDGSAVLRFLNAIVCIVLVTSAVEAQDLSEWLAIIRSNKPGNGLRIFEIIKPYIDRTKSIENEWSVIQSALDDPLPYARDQALAFLTTLEYFNAKRPVAVPEAIQQRVIQQFSSNDSTTRAAAVRIIALMDGGPPPSLVPRMLQIARTDPDGSVREAAIAGLPNTTTPSTATVQFWMESLRSTGDPLTRRMVLTSFQTYSPKDPEVIRLVIEALRDPSQFFRQQAIAAVVNIGKPAASAIPLLEEIRDSQSSDETLRSSAASAIRILSGDTPNR